MIDLGKMSFGAEHEFADVDATVQLPTGWYRDPEHTIVNSNGIAADPKVKLWKFGCEINPTPTFSVDGQVEHLDWIRKRFPEARVNYRSNLHIHVRVPGLKDSLSTLKRVQRYIHAHMREAIEVLVPLPRPDSASFSSSEEFDGALRRWRRRGVSHRSLLTKERLERQLRAKSIEEFFALEPPASKAGKPLFHAQPRLCVSLRQLLQTDTVEFRHFPGTLNLLEMSHATDWCGMFLKAAIDKGSIIPLISWARGVSFPQFPPYIYEMERRFRATVHDGTLSPEQIEKNIQIIVAEEKRFPLRGDLQSYWENVSRYYKQNGGPSLELPRRVRQERTAS